MAVSEKKLVYALRHSPQTFELRLDKEGWVDLQTFLQVMGLSKQELKDIIANSNKKRLEVRGNKIRAYYGHSFADKVEKASQRPPDVLYHGTSSFAAFIIKREGIKPMSRQYVHLSTTPQTAQIVGERKGSNPVILRIDAKRAFEDGIKFYFGNEDVWLSDFVPSDYIFN